MGWTVSLVDRSAKPICDFGALRDGACPDPCYPPVSVDRHTEGGTIAIGGLPEASVSITYNYGTLYREAFDDPAPAESNILGRMLEGRRAGDVVPLLQTAVDRLGTETDDNYWTSTPGNAGHMLNVLLGWARQHPDAVFEVC